MSSIERIVIVGAGLAGSRAADALRKEGYEGSITLVGDEPAAPYLRPPLSKEYLRGEEDLDHVYLHPEAYYAEQAIELRVGTTVQAIEPASHEVVLADGARLGYDRLLIATGARPRELTVPGADLPGVVTLRTLADADALRAAAPDARRIAVVGAGWIGSEVAASLRMLGREVVLVAPDAAPLERVLGARLGALYGELHRAHGVDLRLGTTVARITGEARVDGIETGAGERIDADLVVTGIGVTPRTELALGAGLVVGDGLEVDATFETSAPDVFAVGDVASAWHPFYERRLRSEHWANARFGGTAAGLALLGGTAPYDRLPYFYSDQYEVSMEYTGHTSADDELVVRGDLGERAFIAFWLADGRVVAGMNVNTPKVAKSIDRLIRSRAEIPPEVLADPSIALDDLGLGDTPG